MLTEAEVPSGLPEKLAVLALKRGVLLPCEQGAYSVGRTQSLATVSFARPAGYLIVVPQVDPGGLHVAADDVHPIGTLAKIVGCAPRVDGVSLVVQGVIRVRLTGVEIDRDRDDMLSTAWSFVDGDSWDTSDPEVMALLLCL